MRQRAPLALANISSKKINDLQGSLRQSLKKYYSEGVGKSKVQWTVAAAATAAWEREFPGA
jgi:aminopeptidase